MKLHLYFLLLVAVGAYAFSSAGEGVLVPYQPIKQNAPEDRLRTVIQRYINTVQKLGWDPLKVERMEFDIPYSSSPDFVAKAFIENLDITGLSDVRINHLKYDYILNTMSFEFWMPEINLSLGNSDIKAVIRGKEFDGQLRGSMSINNLGVKGLAYIDIINIHGHAIVKDVSLETSLGGIKANFSAIGQGVDRSEDLNNLMMVKLPAFHKNNKDYIDTYIGNTVLLILFFVCCI